MQTKTGLLQETRFLFYNHPMSAALGLHRLQKIDSQMDQARTRLESIRQTLENDAELRAANERVRQASARQAETERDLRNAEAEVQSQKIKIEQTESNLYSGSVRNPKELQDLQKDVASLKKHLATLEDRLLEAMLANDASASSLTEAGEALSEVRSRRGDQVHSLDAEQSELTHILERFDAERKAAIAPLNSDDIELYESLRLERRGVAVATVNDGACSACGTTLTPAHRQAARSSASLVHCPTCNRFLFAD